MMTGSLVAGTVTARVVLDTSEFKSAVSQAKETINTLKTTLTGLNKVSGGKGIQNTFKYLKDSTKTVTQAKNNINQLRESLQQLGKTGINLNTFKTNMNAINQATSKLTVNQKKVTKELQRQANLEEKLASQRHRLYSNQQKNNLNTYKSNLGKVNQEVSKQTNQLKVYDTYLKKVNQSYGKQTQSTQKLAAEQHRVYTKNHIHNLNSYKANLSAINRELSKQIALANRNKLASKMWNINTTKTPYNYSQYIAQINQVNNALKTQMNRTNQLASAQHRLYNQYHTTNLNSYKANMGAINKQLSQQVSAQNKSVKSTQKMGKAMSTLNAKTNYVNKNLWKLRGIILGVRTIFLSFGGIYIWQFFEEMISATKETLAVKSEMEQFLKMNEKLGQHNGGIDRFNKGLDETINKFKKLNKYTLGETVASIGKEFNLTASEMVESMDVIAMVQSEYVRAGRKESEAALAVKDILQGEFRRLSMETGVGEKELKALGWSGKKEDVMGLMEAIKKAGTSRHWDDFARKATSLTDVFNILKNRMAEFGAEIADAITPAIVASFNTMADAFDWLKEKYNGLSTGMKLGINVGAITAGFGALSVVILKLWKGFGLMDVAAVGFKKSMATAVLGLNIADVRMHGFWKTLMGTLTKTNAASVANVGLGKSFATWILGADQAIVKEHGLLTAMASHTYSAKNMVTVIDHSSISTLKWYQKLAMAKKGMDASTASSYGLGKSLRTLVFNFNLLKKAVALFTILNVIKTFADLSMYMEKAKKNIHGFYKVVDDGKNITKDATDEYNRQHARVTELAKKVEEFKKQKKDLTQIQQEYNQAVSNETQAKANLDDITTATERAKKAQKSLNDMMGDINLNHQKKLAEIYQVNGEGAKEAQVHASKYNQTVTEGYKQQTLAYHQYNKRLEQGVLHMQEHIGFLKQSGVTSKDLLKYADDYDAILQETSKHWKKFWEGDIWSGASALLGELKLAFIDLNYNPHFIALTKELNKTWKSWQPTIKSLSNSLGDLLNKAMDLAASFLSTDIGKTTALWGGLSLVVGAVGIKIGKFLLKGKNVITFFSNLGSKLSEVIPKLKRYGDMSSKTPTSTTPTTVPTTTVPGGVEKGKFWSTVGQDARNIGRTLAKASMYLAGAMLLATEAIALLNAPMLSLALTGVTFKRFEPQIRSGIEGLKLIAPTILILLPPVVALMVVMEKFGDSLNPASAAKAFGYSAAAIAGSLLLVAEAIIMLSVPLGAIAGLGWVRSQLGEGNIQQGLDTIKLVGEALKSLVPFIPIFALGVGLLGAAIISGGIGTVVTVAVVGGIALGMGILAESIVSLAIPLRAIEALGNIQVNMDAVRRGGEVIKATGEALKSVSEAVGSMGDIIWDDLKLKIGEFVTGSSVIDEITKEGGLVDKIVDFNLKFNTKVASFTPINPDLVTKFAQSATGIKQVGDAINKITSVMNTLPQLSGDNPAMFTPLGQMINLGGQAISSDATDSASLKDYLTQVEKIIGDVSNFNNRLSQVKFVDPPSGLVGQLQSSVTFINQVKGVVDKLQGTMQSALGTQVTAGASNLLSGGAVTPMGAMISGAWNALTGGGSGGYKSSIGSALQSMEDVIDDLVTFNTRINGKSIEDSPNVSGLVNFVTAVNNAITNVETALSSAKPRLETNANGLGQSLSTGFNKGIQSLKNVKVIEVILQGINATKGTLLQSMVTLGWETRTKFTTPVSGMSDAMKSEMGQIGDEIDSGKTANGNKAYGLGKYLVSQFKAGAGIASPGDMYRALLNEVGYMGNAIQMGINTLPTQVQHLATAMVNQFDPRFNTDFLNFTQNTDGLNQFNKGMEEVKETSEDTLTSTNTTFSNMRDTINLTFDNITTNTVKKYTQLKNTTKNSLASMQNQTTRHIGQIKSSWKGMQSALIASADAILTHTTSKIDKLQDNMRSFWRKIKNPSLLLGGSAGSPTIRSRRRPSRSVGVKRSVGSTLRGGGFAGSPSPSKRGGSAGGSSIINTPFRKGSSSKDFAMRDAFDEYLKILFNGDVPYAGGWNFNWSKDIQKILMGWGTNFPKPYTSINKYLKVGSFANSDMPVKGKAGFAKQYIKDVIGQTSYDFYFNSHHGNNPLAIWKAGKFNCWDGAHLVMALASALGFPGGSIVHGYWNGIRHVWARIPGLGDIDSTAIQHGYGFTSPKVRAAGSPAPHSKDDFGTNNTYNIEVTVHVEGNADKRVMEEAGEVAGRKIIDLLKPSMATGR